MQRRLVIVGALILFLAGFVFLRGPTPAIKIKPETIASLEPGGFTINVTNTMITSWLVVALIVIVVFLATRRRELVPRGAQNFVEWLVVEGEFVLGNIRVPFMNYNFIESLAGERNGRRFFPLVTTIFFFVLIANWVSLLPVFNVIGLAKEEEHGFVMEQSELGPLSVAWVGLSGPGQLSGESIEEDDPEAEARLEEEREKGNLVGEIIPVFRGINTDLNTPLALAIVSAIAVESWGISSLGFRAYGRKFINVGGIFGGLFRLNFAQLFQGVIDAFVGFLELVSETVRLISFTFRLFGNMFAGEIVILVFSFLVPLLIGVGALGLELFVGFIQAFIFAILTLVFAAMAVAHGEHAAHEDKSNQTTGQLKESEA